MAAQIVSGIGFLGAGLIFVRRDAVRGLTTAAAVWLTAAIGMAAGADLPILATGMGYAVLELATDQYQNPGEEHAAQRGLVTVRLLVQGQQPATQLAAALSELDGVHAVSAIREAVD